MRRMLDLSRMDRIELILFIDSQFRRLGMYYNAEVHQCNEFVRQLDTRTRWYVLMRVVDYVNRKMVEYFD